jgi:DHA1 family multidrug resistance protein-like MFS transporter
MSASSAFFRGTLPGQIVRYISGNRLFQYPEEKSGFVIPDLSKKKEKEEKKSEETAGSSGHETLNEAAGQHQDAGNKKEGDGKDVEKNAEEPLRKEEQPKLLGAAEMALIASKSENYIIVDWYSDTDAENPQNWPASAKNTVMFCLYIATFAIYAGSSIITLGYGSLIEEFGISEQQATLTLSMYVLAYGVGAMIWSPLSEIPILGRNIFYWAPIALFVLIQVAAPLTHNFSGLVAVRFFTGFLGSPVLATAGASLQDVYNPMYLPIVFSLWALSAFMGPSIGPLVAGVAAQAHDWRWTMWELLWLVGFAEILLILFMPETHGPTILLRRAQRLRKLTGNEKYRSMGELEMERLTLSEIMMNAFVRPTQIIIQDPQILFSDLYIALIYGAYYLFFAAFPQWQARLGWDIGIQGVSYVVILIGGIIGCLVYVAYQVTYMPHLYKTKGWPEPEQRLEPALIGSILLPIGLFIFGESSTSIAFHCVGLHRSFCSQLGQLSRKLHG